MSLDRKKCPICRTRFQPISKVHTYCSQACKAINYRTLRDQQVSLKIKAEQEPGLNFIKEYCNLDENVLRIEIKKEVRT